jgi:hypothetical protein
MALQYVADANLQTVTLGSNYTLGDTSMVLTNGEGARLPSSGDFWIMTPDTAPPNRIIWKVTARSSDTLTVVYDNSYGADANLTAGTRLMWSLTAEALTQLKTDIAGNYGTFANLPAATAGVVRYDFTDSPYSHAISDGSAWHYFMSSAGEVTPTAPASAWTGNNVGSSSISDTYGNIFATFVHTVASLETYYKSFAGATFDIRGNLDWMIGTDNFQRAGIALLEGGASTKRYFFGYRLQSLNYVVETWSDDAGSSVAQVASFGAANGNQGSGPKFRWFRIVRDATNLIFYLGTGPSQDWIQVYSVARNTFFSGAPLYYGFSSWRSGGGSGTHYVWCNHLREH